MPTDLEPILVNVRKAYRLLNAYHFRILSVVPQIGEKLSKQFSYWYSDPEWPGRSTNPGVFGKFLELMPLHYASFVFSPSDSVPRPGQWLLEVTHIGDTGFSDSEHYDPASLDPPEHTHSKLYLSAALVAAGDAADWKLLWEGCSYPDDDPDNVRSIAGIDCWEGVADGCEVRVFGKDWSVADFADEAALNARCAEFQSLVTVVTGSS